MGGPGFYATEVASASAARLWERGRLSRTIASPLLAGFSLASVVIVSNDAANFRWPGAVILTLSIAAVTLIGAVQCAFNTRQHLWSGADVRSWWPCQRHLKIQPPLTAIS